MAPTTPFEDNGYTTYTSLAQETALLQQIAAETDATYSVAGYSVQGRPINRLDLGTPTKGTHVVVTGQHANELPPREGVLIWIRDMAYSTDPAVQAYFAEHRVVVLTTCNPDRFNTGRENINGVDLNRDHVAVTQPESQAIARTIHTTGAHLVSDHHGRQDLSGPIPWEGTYGKAAATHRRFTPLGQGLVAAVGSGLDGSGYTGWREYHPSEDARLMLSNSAGYHHALGFLSEAWQGTPQFRVQVTHRVLESIRTWHAARAFDLSVARAASIESSINNLWAYPIHGGTHIATQTVDWIDPPPVGYSVPDGVPQRLAECFGVHAKAGTVAMGQAAGRVIPQLFDAASPDAVGGATRIAGTGDPVGPEPTPVVPVSGGRKVVAIYAGVNGRTVRITEAWHRTGGVTRRLRL